MHPHVTYILDHRYLRPTLVSAWSLLSHRPKDITVLFLFSEPVGEARRALDLLARQYPDATLEGRYEKALDHGHSTRGHVSPAALARLCLPRLLQGKTLYLDGDTMVCRDVGPLFSRDLSGHPVAAVRDVGIQRALHYRATGRRPSRKARKHLDYLEKCSDLFTGRDYVNSGVMLFDLPRIRGLGLDAEMMDIAKAVEIRQTRNLLFNDQTWLNIVFNGHIDFLPAEWNTFWGNRITARAPFPEAEQKAYAASREDPAIVHFVGKIRPWEVRHPVFYPKRKPWLGRYLDIMKDAAVVLA